MQSVSSPQRKKVLKKRGKNEIRPKLSCIQMISLCFMPNKSICIVSACGYRLTVPFPKASNYMPRSKTWTHTIIPWPKLVHTAPCICRSFWMTDPLTKHQFILFHRPVITPGDVTGVTTTEIESVYSNYRKYSLCVEEGCLLNQEFETKR